MAEVIAAISVIASVAQLADYGFKLSVKLFTFSQAVTTADESIKGISNDVSLTSTVLQELSLIIKADESRVVSPGAIAATKQTVAECLKVFEQLNDALDKSLGNLEGKGEGKGKVKRGTIALERLKWPFKQPKMELLRSNLDRLKASLTLMLQVLSYARDVSNQKAAESSLAYQQHLIETLARSERTMKQRYHSLQVAIEYQDPPPAFDAYFSKASVEFSTSRGFDNPPTPQYVEPASPPLVKPRTLVGELLLCFQLLSDLLGYHVAVTKCSELSSLGYDELREMVEKVKATEMRRLEADFGNAPIYTKAEAAQNLHTRLRELARVGYLKKRLHEEVTVSKETDTGDRRHGLDPTPILAIGRTTNDKIETVKVQPRPPASWDQVYKLPPARQKGYSPPVQAPPPLANTPLPSIEAEKIAAIQERMKKESELQEPIQSYDPYIPSPHTAANNQKTTAIQAQIDDTVGTMRENIARVAQRGERLDSLSDKTDYLASAQGFRRGNRTRGVAPWSIALGSISAVGQSVVKLGSEGYKIAQGLGGSIVEAGTKIFTEDEDKNALNDELEGGSIISSEEIFDRFGGNEDEDSDGDIVGDLLAQWTTLRLHEGPSGEDQIENNSIETPDAAKEDTV